MFLKGIKLATAALMTLRVSSTLLSEVPEGTPLQIHHAFNNMNTEESTGLSFTWTTRENSTRLLASKCNVVRVTNSDGATRDFMGLSNSYNTTDDLLHTVDVTGLEFEMDYSYQVGCDRLRWSDTHHFTSPPRPVTQDTRQDLEKSFSFLSYGDMGVGNSAVGTKDAIIKDDTKYEFLLHNGDISYACGADGVWDQWFDLIEPYANKFPYMTTQGNHDLLPADSGGEDGIPYATRFKMPDDGSNLIDNKLYYSFTHRYVKFIQIATDVPYYGGDDYDGDDTEQYKWLEQELIDANSGDNRLSVPWIIISGHKPMYCSSTYGTNDRSSETGLGNSGSITRYLEPLLEKYNVDVFLAGHIHAYERTKPVGGNGTLIDEDSIRPNPDGIGDIYASPSHPVHLLLGMAGAGHLDEEWNVWDDGAWAVHNEETYGYMSMTFHNASAFEMTFIANGNGVLANGTMLEDSELGVNEPSVHDRVIILK